MQLFRCGSSFHLDVLRLLTRLKSLRFGVASCTLVWPVILPTCKTSLRCAGKVTYSSCKHLRRIHNRRTFGSNYPLFIFTSARHCQLVRPPVREQLCSFWTNRDSIGHSRMTGQQSIPTESPVPTHKHLPDPHCRVWNQKVSPDAMQRC